MKICIILNIHRVHPSAINCVGAVRKNGSLVRVMSFVKTTPTMKKVQRCQWEMEMATIKSS